MIVHGLGNEYMSISPFSEESLEPGLKKRSGDVKGRERRNTI